MIKRYQSAVMEKIWNDETKFNNMLKVELAVCRVYYERNVITKEEWENLQKAKFSVERIQELELNTKHDVIAFTRCLSESLGNERKWIHYGLTSTDVVDTAQALTLKEANDYIEKALNKFINVLKNKALEYKNTFCIGRTHGMHAEVTSFGLKWCLFYDEMIRNKERFLKARSLVETGKVGGAVGNYANTDIDIEKRVCEILNINAACISTQVLSRDRHAEYIVSLAFIASTMEKIATEIRHLSRNEVGEVAEDFKVGQKGSSAMPHKHNPISSENICGCARVVKSYVQVAFENNILWHERDISHSSAERIILPDATSLIEYMLNRYSNTLDKLKVYPEKMQKNIDFTKGQVYSGHVLSSLILKDISREKAYDLVQELTNYAYQNNLELKDVVKEKLKMYFNDQELDELFNQNYYLKEVDNIYRKLKLED